ncbi:MAG: hypothetical protein ABI846_11780 [Rudaea sp.]
MASAARPRAPPDRGGAVDRTDMGTGSGYFACADARGVRLVGTCALRGEAILAVAAGHAQRDARIAIWHAHSQGNPEAAWRCFRSRTRRSSACSAA